VTLSLGKTLHHSPSSALLTLERTYVGGLLLERQLPALSLAKMDGRRAPQLLN